MFTIKLFQQDELTIVECEDLRVRRDPADGSAQVMAFMKGNQQTFYVGQSRVAGDLGKIVYDKAIVENAAGKTTEIVTPRPVVQAKTSDSGRTLKEWQDWMRDHPGEPDPSAKRLETILKPGEVIR